jgi:hypothetical protein
MKRVPEPTTSPGDDLDALLRAYFRAQMPAPWPAFRAPGKARLLPFRGRAQGASAPWVGRAVLVAASLFLLAAMALMPRPTGGGSYLVTPPVRMIGEPEAKPGALPRGPGSVKPGQLTPDRPGVTPRPEHDGGHTGFKIPLDD